MNWKVRGVKNVDSIEDTIYAESRTEASNIFKQRHPGYSVYSVAALT